MGTVERAGDSSEMESAEEEEAITGTELAKRILERSLLQ